MSNEMTFCKYLAQGNKYVTMLKKETANGIEKEILLFGTGATANFMYGVLSSFLKISGFCSSYNIHNTFRNLPVYCINDIPKKNYKILLTLDKRHLKDICPRLEEQGQTDLMLMDLETQNAVLAFYYNQVISKYHIDISGQFCNINGVTIRNPFLLTGRELQAIFIELNDLLFGDILNSYDLLSEGPYLYLDSVLREGDVVLDCGANLGMFSAIAAAHKCTCYAFEPTEQNFKDLTIYESVYPGQIIPCQYALSDCAGSIQLALSELGDMSNTIMLEQESFSLGDVRTRETVDVEAITVDEFVEKEKLTHVDFIKADIEGAERLMLKGARKTLAKFAPKLAICTYHYEDDPQVLEQLILEANPHYIIEHRWKKLYAHVPLLMK